MGFVIGFGSTEQEFEQQEQRAITEWVAAEYRARGLGYFTDAFVADVGRWVQSRADELHAQSRRYKTAEDYPSRYSEYWPTVFGDASNIAVIMSIHHINRRHALSHDGWAVMQTKPIFAINTWDDIERYAPAKQVPA